MHFTLTTSCPDDTEKLAKMLAPMLGKGDVLLLHGVVGAGKTDLARKIIQNIMIKYDAYEDVPSPTFTLVQTYDLGEIEFIHADLYRLSHSDEVYELGLDRAFDEAVCLIEWPDRLGSLAPQNALIIEIKILDDTSREIQFLWTDPRWVDRMDTVINTRLRHSYYMISRIQKRDNFIKSIGWDDAGSVVVAGDASNRSYDRLTKAGGQTAILMNAPPEKGEDVRPFVKVLEYLRTNGLEAPELLAVDDTHGFLLLEDLGDDLFARICRTSPELENTLYRAAIDVLLQLHKAPAPNGVAPYDLATYLRETDLVTDWYLPSITGAPTSPSVIEAYQSTIATACTAMQTAEPVLVLRDYHAENLLWLPMRAGVKNVGLLDFQDALIGHPAYDLVSLLEDARRDTLDTLQVEMKEYFIQKSGVNKDDFNYAYATLGAQRNLKIIGIFARLCLRDGKPQYIDLIPRVWAHLERDLAHAQLADLREWVELNIPEPTPAILAKFKEAKNAS